MLNSPNLTAFGLIKLSGISEAATSSHISFLLSWKYVVARLPFVQPNPSSYYLGRTLTDLASICICHNIGDLALSAGMPATWRRTDRNRMEERSTYLEVLNVTFKQNNDYFLSTTYLCVF